MSPRSAQRRKKKSRKGRRREVTSARAAHGTTRYYELYELLSGELKDGAIPPGSALPSEPELVSIHKLSRTTVRRALARLEDEGRILRRRGSGTYAREVREPERLFLNLETFYSDVAALAEQASAAILRFGRARVPAIFQQFQPEIGERALLVQRLRRYNGSPYELATAYIPESIGRQIRRNTLNGDSIVTVLDRIGSPIASTEHTTSAVAADPVAARRLDVALGAPLLRTRAILSDGRGRVVAIKETLCRPDRFRVRAALERTPPPSSPSWRLRAR